MRELYRAASISIIGHRKTLRCFIITDALPVLASNIHVGIASGCSISEQVTSHLAPKDDLHTARDQISSGTIQKKVPCDGCFLVSRLLKTLVLHH